MAGVSRGEALLQKWGRDPQKALTPSGADWFIAAADPFHDHELKNLHGWPDVETGMSVVRTIRQTVNMSKPASFPAANWDCHIALLPWQQFTAFAQSATRSNNTFTFSGASTRGPLGGLTICPALAGVDADWLPVTGTGNNKFATIPLAFEQGVGRLIGVGYEVHCTADDLTNRGNLLCYRQTQGTRDQTTFTGYVSDSAALVLGDYTFTGTPFRLPPKNASEAVLQPGTRQWAFKDGLYQVGTFHTIENPTYAGDYNEPVLLPPGNDDAFGVDNQTQIAFPVGVTNSTSVTKNTVAFQKYSAPLMHVHPLHQSGCILSGLADGSSFNINVVWYYETFPSTTENAIISLARPSAEYDPMALAMYSHALSVMPVGVKVNENSSGDWFYDLVSTVGKIAMPILSAIPHPVAKALLPVAMAASTMERPSGKRKKVQNKNASLAQGTRGKKGKVQGPLPPPGKMRS